jgi:hypothetical protein
MDYAAGEWEAAATCRLAQAIADRIELEWRPATRLSSSSSVPHARHARARGQAPRRAPVNEKNHPCSHHQFCHRLQALSGHVTAINLVYARFRISDPASRECPPTVALRSSWTATIHQTITHPSPNPKRLQPGSRLGSMEMDHLPSPFPNLWTGSSQLGR